ncbi:MAG: hypothetical protein ACOYY2_09705 [Actinomycetota bacterium]
MVARPVTVNDVLDGHVTLDLECLDRVYLNGYVPNLQVPGQVVVFLTRHLGFPIPSPAIFDQIGGRFRRAVASYAQANDIPLVRFAKGDRKIEVMRPHLARAAAAGGSRVAAIGVAQEFAPVFTGTQREGREGSVPSFSFAKVDRRVTCYYFYLWDDDFGPAFVKVCAYFPYPMKICLLTELPKRRARAVRQIGGGVDMVPARERVRRARPGSACVDGAADRCPVRDRRSVRAVPAA